MRAGRSSCSRRPLAADVRVARALAFAAACLGATPLSGCLAASDTDDQPSVDETENQPAATWDGTRNTTFWIAVNDNHVMDKQLRAFLNARARRVIFNGKAEDSIPAYALSELMPRMTGELSGEVLGYSMAHQAHVDADGRLWNQILEGYGDYPLLATTPRWYSADLTVAATREDLAADANAVLNGTYMTEGILIDSFKRSGPVANGDRPCSAFDLPAAECAYADGSEKLLQEYKKAFGTNKVFVNGLWNHLSRDDEGTGDDSQIDDGVRLLTLASSAADGVAVEMFGRRDPESADFDDWNVSFRPYLDRMAASPVPPGSIPSEKHVAFFGRGTSAYQSYRDEIEDARYAYAAYLLAANNNTSFQYNCNFQLARGLSCGRSDAVTVFRDQTLKLGTPEPSGYTVIEPDGHCGGGLLRRATSSAVVIVNPKCRTSNVDRDYIVEHTGSDSDGNVVTAGDRLTIAPGTARILVHPAIPAQTSFATLSFGGTPPQADWQWASIGAGGPAGNFLHVDTTSHEYEHDLMLDFIKGLDTDNRPCLQFSYRIDPDDNASITVAGEINNSTNRHVAAQIVLERTTNDDAGPTTRPRIYYHDDVNRDRLVPSDDIQVLTADGDWQSVVVDLGAAVAEIGTGADTCGDAGCQLKRTPFMRLHGTLDIDEVQLRPKTDGSCPSP
jgi:hypothetical protein